VTKNPEPSENLFSDRKALPLEAYFRVEVRR